MVTDVQLKMSLLSRKLSVRCVLWICLAHKTCYVTNMFSEEHLTAFTAEYIMDSLINRSDGKHVPYSHP